MNELYALDPEAPQTALELRMVLERFGPSTGRYLASLPTQWEHLVHSHFAEKPPIEQQRAVTAVRRARERRATLRTAELTRILRSEIRWSAVEAWRENACRNVRLTRVLDGAIVASGGASDELPRGVVELADLELPATAEKEVQASESELVRACSFLISFGGDLHLVDPYFDPTKRNVSSVIDKLLARMAESEVPTLSIWTRDRLLIQSTFDAWQRAVRGWGRGSSRPGVTVYLLDDTELATRMHARHLFSSFGGVAIDNGFAAMPRGATTKVSPLSESVLVSYLAKYRDGEGRGRIVRMLTRA